ncbi:hypothetical protein SAMN05892883_1592 [Jatrophihabitans sp. GAS493]|uniref:hypothetical protein n=1 Tax=Jatrophihabitans sp. GAS493 TaxID=1907575 RepID=UPI000BB8AD5F|nr:hypothetical protein [Jatrophihabitans sp. GAS493]SOD72168.1 hypothetical protein SAMN05892883_1592 [Jatrophihabitans sp. GAS493]
MAAYFGAIGIIGGIAGALHSDNALKWIASIALLIAGVAASIRILAAGFIVSDSGVRVRAVWRTWTVPWAEVYHISIEPMSSHSLTGPIGSLQLTTTAGQRLRSQAITAPKPTSPQLVAALASLEDARQSWEIAHPGAVAPTLVHGRSPRVQFTVLWYPGTAEPPSDELWVAISMRVLPGEATLHLAVGYTERLQQGSLRDATANPNAGDVTFHVHTDSGVDGRVRTTRADARLIAHELD